METPTVVFAQLKTSQTILFSLSVFQLNCEPFGQSNVFKKWFGQFGTVFVIQTHVEYNLKSFVKCQFTWPKIIFLIFFFIFVKKNPIQIKVNCTYEKDYLSKENRFSTTVEHEI